MACPCCGKPWAAALQGRGGWRDRVFARLMSRGAVRYNQLLGERKQALFGEIGWGEGIRDLLEVGLGTGANAKYYAANTALRVTGVDPNPAMASWARQAMADAGLPPENVTVMQGVAEELPVEDESQDAVVCTLVLCSVASPAAALSEAHRVLRPGGKLLFMEHVAAPRGTLVRRLQDLWNPAQLWLAECNCNRQTWEALEAAGFRSLRAERFVATPNPLFALIAPHVAGVAVK
ncbi:MAG: S-adenosyl-L-methionine-dependent methyltransferase [Monoraphidium minutum]|nr:MAG: S-adenosyl-L-methionine-dependent methyltransferase [Monoraphidium minutum]